MGNSLVSIVAAGCLLIACNETDRSHDMPVQESVQETAETSFDSVYAQKLGADDYGMRKYVMAFLKKGPNRDQDDSTKNALQSAHMANISRMTEEGTLVLAGPFLDNGDLRGIYIFAVDSLQQAEELTNSDPAVQAGVFSMELHEWYGSAAIMEVSEIHEQISKIKF